MLEKINFIIIVELLNCTKYYVKTIFLKMFAYLKTEYNKLYKN